ncbi:MAG: SGNH/GDSL hydrolase family protein [Desulfobacterales bacterium]|nr:SGNH/GDSL hydrolase family protein [Desulfobacterales bacterium]
MDNILKLALGPILLWQGKHVRKITPRLPEANGPRHGTHGSGPRKITLLVIGDSAAAGVGVDSQENSLAGQLVRSFGSEFSVSWMLLAKSGITTAGMNELLLTRELGTFDLAVTSLGVNDVKSGVPPLEWLKQQKQLISYLKHSCNIRQIVISAVPPMEKFPALPWPLGWFLGRQAKEMNSLMAKWISKQKGLHFLEFNIPLESDLMAKDGFHPGPKLHTIWAGQAIDLVCDSLIADKRGDS